MNFKNITDKVKDWWQKGTIQRTSRITYDVVWNVILFFIIIGVMGVFFAGGVGAGYFASLVKDEPIRSYEEMEKKIYNYEETSKVYFADNKLIGDIRTDLHREEVKLENVAETLTNAVIATEDELFYDHNGVVPKAIVRAMFQEVSNSDTKTGGSTLTQQIIKNQILTNEVSFDRKAKEILLAMRLENFFEKEQILEAYLNIIPYGRNASGDNIAGIQTAAKGVFGVKAEELTLPQAAFLAGIPKNPYAYTPFKQNGDIKDEDGLKLGLDRMKTVLSRMKQAGYITDEEYKEAIEHDITKDFTKKAPSSIEKYPAVVLEIEKRAKTIIMEVLAEDDGYTLEEIEKNEELEEQYDMLADRALRMNGYEIHSTIDKEVFDTMQKVAKEYPYYGPDRTVPKTGEVEQVETGAEIIENKTGRILGFVPGRNFKAGEKEVNYATGYGTTGRPAGSTFKPIAVFGPAMELGAAQPGTVIADIPGHQGYAPNNFGGAYNGLVTAREAVTYSYNVSTIEVYKSILGQNPADKFLKKMNIPLTKELEQDPSVGLGSNNVTVEQNTNAFTTFSNGGEFVEAYMIEKIVDSDGNTIYEHEPEPVKVFSKQTSYLMIDIMRDVVSQGTGAYVPSRLKHGGVDWAGKSGTSQDYQDAWFIGTNPNITMGVWLGYNTPSSIYSCGDCGGLSYSQRTQQLWVNLMNAVSDVKPELMAPSKKYEQPEGIVNSSFCATSGDAPSDLCSKAGLVRSDIFNSKYVPSKTDNSLVGGGSTTMTKIDGKEVVAGSKTPSEFTSKGKGGYKFNPEFLKEKGYDRLGDLSVLIPRKGGESWSKITATAGKGSSASSSVSDTGKAPSAPGSISGSKSSISWSGVSGQNVVGYRLYHAKDKDGSFKSVGSTTGTSLSLPSGGGAYHVRAVDYFGRESGASDILSIKPSKEEKKDDAKDKKKDDKKKDEDKDKNKDKKENDKDKKKEKKDDDNKKEEKPKDKEKEKKKENDKKNNKDKKEDKKDE